MSDNPSYARRLLDAVRLLLLTGERVTPSNVRFVWPLTADAEDREVPHAV